MGYVTPTYQFFSLKSFKKHAGTLGTKQDSTSLSRIACITLTKHHQNHVFSCSYASQTKGNISIWIQHLNFIKIQPITSQEHNL